MTAAAPVLGIDPGHDGAAVLLDGAGEPRWAGRWRPLKRTKDGVDYRVYRLDWEPLGGALYSSEHRTVAGVGAALSAQVRIQLGEARLHLVAEGLFVFSMARGDAGIELGKTVGWLTAGLLEHALSYDEPRARKWRPDVLGCNPAESSDEAERLALLRWRSRWSGHLANDAHVAEAECLAWYRWTWLRLAALQPALLEPAPKRRARR
jgi:hypothetical protein